MIDFEEVDILPIGSNLTLGIPSYSGYSHKHNNICCPIFSSTNEFRLLEDAYHQEVCMKATLQASHERLRQQSAKRDIYHNQTIKSTQVVPELGAGDEILLEYVLQNDNEVVLPVAVSHRLRKTRMVQSEGYGLDFTVNHKICEAHDGHANPPLDDLILANERHTGSTTRSTGQMPQNLFEECMRSLNLTSSDYEAPSQSKQPQQSEFESGSLEGPDDRIEDLLILNNSESSENEATSNDSDLEVALNISSTTANIIRHTSEKGSLN